MKHPKFSFPLLLTLSVAVAPLAVSADQPDGHRMVDAAQLEWQPVGSLPPGAKIAVIEGPMDQAVPFTVRAMLPANYRIPPHWHPATERVTVLSGVFHMGLGEVFDADSGHALGPGSAAIMEVGTRHYAWTEEETVIQLHGTGPWGIHYVNPEDDPRRSR